MSKSIIETAPEGISEAGLDAPPPMTLPRSVLYSLANLGYGMFYAMNNAAIPLFLQAYTKNNVLLGLMGSSHSFEGAIIQPLVGSASDRLRTSWGRRLPFMLIFIPLSALFFALTPLAAHLPAGIRLGAVIAAIFLFTVFFNIAQDPYQALMPDITPVPQRGRVTGVWTLLGVLGQAGIMVLPLPITTKFSLAAGVMVVTTLITCLAIREPKHPAVTSERHGWSEVAEALNGLKLLHQARRAIAALFFSGLGIGAVLPFLTLFVKTIAHSTDQQAQMMFLTMMLSAAVMVIPFGWLADRFGPKRVLLLGQGVLTLAALNGLWVQTLAQMIPVFILAGIGYAAQSASNYPLLTDIVPAEEVGFYTGLQSTALSIATPLTTAVTGYGINVGSYRIIFAVCAVCILISLLILTTIQVQSAAQEVLARDTEQGRLPSRA